MRTVTLAATDVLEVRHRGLWAVWRRLVDGAWPTYCAPFTAEALVGLPFPDAPPPVLALTTTPKGQPRAVVRAACKGSAAFIVKHIRIRERGDL